jgi:hypothetical protein
MKAMISQLTVRGLLALITALAFTGAVTSCTTTSPPVNAVCSLSVSAPTPTVRPGSTVKLTLRSCGKHGLAITYVPTKYVYPSDSPNSLLPDNGAYIFGAVAVTGSSYAYTFPQRLQWRGVFVLAPADADPYQCKTSCKFATTELDVLDAN